MTRPFAISTTLAAALLAVGCASKPAPAPAPATQIQPLAEYMNEAAKARGERLLQKERDTYRTAARLYPTAKEPWAKLAESYFEAGDYGNAILAAQEVLQRDNADAVATSVLAVSGLRVSTQALGALHHQNGKLPSDSRSQAETLTRTLRELLGEPVLVPQPAESAAAAPAPAPAPAPAQRARTPRPATAAGAAAPARAPAGNAPAAPRPAAAAAPAPAPTPSRAPAAPRNPFDALK